MDLLDTNILRDLRGNCRLPYSELAIKYNTSSQTIQNRVRHLQETGTIVRFNVLPSMLLAGVDPLLIHTSIDIRVTKRSVEDLIGSNPLVAEVHSNGNSEYIIMGYYRDQTDLLSLMKHLKEIKGYDRSQCHYLVASRGNSMVLAKRHLQVIGELLHNPRQNATDIAEKTDLNSKTVRRILLSFTQRGALQFSLEWNSSAGSNLGCIMQIDLDERMSDTVPIRAEMDRICGRHLWTTCETVHGNTVFAFLCAQNMNSFVEVGKNLLSKNEIVSCSSFVCVTTNHYCNIRESYINDILAKSSK